MANEYKILQIQTNTIGGITERIKFEIESSASTPTFSAITVDGNVAVFGNIIGDGSQITNLEFNTGLTGNFVEITGDTMTGPLILNSNLTVTGLTTVYGSILPNIDSQTDLGSPIKRFRDINTVSGSSTIWSASTRVITPELNLGVDSSGNTRTITANNSIIQDDILKGGTF